MKRSITSFFVLLGITASVCGQSPGSTPGVGALRNLANLRDGVKRMRVSSYDRSGANRDFLQNIEAGKKATLAEIQGAGTVTHIWVTISSPERYHLRRVVLRAYWDGETEPSIETPIGDFFGLGYGEAYYWASAPLAVSDRALNCFFPMPFSRGAPIW